jgi:DNA-binding NarL/FixJ family response regulator
MRPHEPATTPLNPAPTPIRIVVADDHVFMRELIAGMLSRQKDRYIVVAAVGTAAEAITTCREFQPHLVILDVNLPDENGIEAVPAIKRASPSTHVLLCTAFPTEDRILDALRVGAKGFVEKTNTWDDFQVAVDRVARGDQYFCSKTTGIMPRTTGVSAPSPTRVTRANLSAREQEVIKLIACGSTSKEIASKLFISPATVETHRTNLMTKLGTRNVAGLVLYAFQHGLVDASGSGHSSR